jgi:hypothetical protein
MKPNENMRRTGMRADQNKAGTEETRRITSTQLSGQFIQFFIQGLQEDASTKNEGGEI